MNFGSIVQFLAETIRTATSKEKLRAFSRISLYRNAVYLMLDEAIIDVTGFAFWIVAARLCEASDVGVASAIVSVTQLLVLLSTLGLDYALVRFLPNAGDESREMTNTCFTVGALVSIALAAIFLAGLSFWSPHLLEVRERPIYAVSFVVFTVACTISTMVMRTYVAARRADFTLAKDTIHGLLKIALIVPLTAFYSFGIFASWGVSLLVAVGIGLFFFLPRAQSGYRPAISFRGGILNRMVGFAFGNYAAALFWLAPTFILPIMVVNRLGEDPNAYFFAAWSIASVLFAISSGTSTSLFAEGSHDEQRLSRDTVRSLKLIFLLLVPAIVLMFLVGGKLLLLFGHDYSREGTKLLWVLSFSALPMSLNYIYFGTKRVEMRMKTVIGLSGFMAVATLGLSYVLLPRLDILGAGVAWLATQTVVAVFATRSLLGHLAGKQAR